MIYTLHARSNHGTYHHLGDYETDYVTFAFKDAVNENTHWRHWISSEACSRLVEYDPDHHDFLDVDNWTIDLNASF